MCPCSLCTHVPVLVSQILESWSKDPVTIKLPCISFSARRGRESARSSAPFPLSVSLSISLRLRLTWALKCSDTISALWPYSVPLSVPYSTSHSLAVFSIEPVAIRSLWGEKLTHTISVW